MGNTPYIENDLDAFGRLRISTPQSLHDWKNLHSRGEKFWNEQTVGAGTITYVPAKSQVDLSVGTGSGDKAIRQSARYYPYFPGKSQVVLLTGIAGGFKENVRKRAGLFDDLNGLFIEFSDLSVRFVRRSDTSGSVVDDVILQENWNIDKMDGTGPSRIKLDSTKTQIFFFDYQWLGVGRVRFGVNIDGKTHYMHSLMNANIRTEAYMSTGSLPIRYEIENTGVSASASTITEICSSVASEGGFQLFGLDGSAGNETTLRSVTTRVPIFAIRLKSSFNGKKNRRTIVLNDATFFSNLKGAYFDVQHVKDHASVTGTWVDYSTGSSGVEFSTDISVVTGGVSSKIMAVYVPAGNNANASAEDKSDLLKGRQHFVSQNMDSTNSELFVVYARQLLTSTAADTSVELKWIEIE